MVQPFNRHLRPDVQDQLQEPILERAKRSAKRLNSLIAKDWSQWLEVDLVMPLQGGRISMNMVSVSSGLDVSTITPCLAIVANVTTARSLRQHSLAAGD